MSSIFTPTWILGVITLLVLIGLGYQTYNGRDQRKAEKAFERCIAAADQTARRWARDMHIENCRDGFAFMTGGRYGTEPDSTITLAMMRRPSITRTY